jgi:hypothetical protein
VTGDGNRADLDPPAPEEEDVIGGVALVEEVRPPAVLADLAVGGEPPNGIRAEALEDRGA